MGSYKWGYDISPLRGVISIVTLAITLLITTHEPPSRVTDSQRFRLLSLSEELNPKPPWPLTPKP